MIRAPKFLISRPMYAFKPDTLRAGLSYGATVDAVWFQRKNRITSAVVGRYTFLVSGFRAPARPDDYEAWVALADDNRHGGSCQATFSGHAVLPYDPPWITPQEAVRLADFLGSVLDGYPDPPVGYDGWWTFPKEKR